jgi:hypothetical protein
MNDDPEMISQPLLTEGGAINSACVNELEAVIGAMKPTHIRLSGDEEWNNRKDQWTFRKDIVGAFAMWACRQSPYGVPEGMENVCKYLFAALKSCAEWGPHDMVEASLCDINRWLHEILMDQGVTEFDAWNRCRVGETPEIQFTSAFDGPTDPDREFIDLHALLHNVCLTIREERRRNRAFDAKFEAQHGPISFTE